MSENFKALVLSQDGENFNREVKSIDKSFLKHGDVTVKVHYSGLNYKDALILKNGCLLYTSPSPRDQRGSRMPSSA